MGGKSGNPGVDTMESPNRFGLLTDGDRDISDRDVSGT